MISLPTLPPDPILLVSTKFRADTREEKVDLGVGVYRDVNGETPIMGAVKSAEQILLEEQLTKSYVGLRGDLEFVDLLGDLLLGRKNKQALHLAGAQTPGGTGAVRLAAELYHAAFPEGRVWIGLPTWQNHFALFEAANVGVQTYLQFKRQTQTTEIEEISVRLAEAKAGDAVLLHGCCHNPSGADFDREEWALIADIIERKQLVPMVDLAYYGFGKGLDEDLQPLRRLVDQIDNVLIAASCSKTFGLYRDRTGAVLFKTTTNELAESAADVFSAAARRMYSMPPDHGAAVVRLILSNSELRTLWESELDLYRARISDTRTALATANPTLFSQLENQNGMFSLLNLSDEEIDRLMREDAVYIGPGGRVNLAGLLPSQFEYFVSIMSKHKSMEA